MLFAMLLTLAHADNPYADACRRSSIAAGSCCGRAECDSKEIAQQHGDLLNAQQKTGKQMGKMGSSAGAGRMEEISQSSAKVQSSVARSCKTRVETCLKQCGNAVKVAEGGNVDTFQEAESYCKRFGEMGSQIESSAEASRQNAGAFGANSGASAADLAN